MVMLSGLQTALSGMKVAQNQMDIIGRNLANIDTVGYTRKTALQSNVVLGGQSAGVQIGDITRTVNEGLLKSYLASNSTTGNLNAKQQYLGKTPLPLTSAICNRHLNLSLQMLLRQPAVIIC